MPRLKLFALLLCGAAGFGLAAAAQSADTAKRKPGLWEIRTQVEGMPSGMGPFRQCVDQNTDNLLEQGHEEQQHDCSTMNVQRAGNRITIHAVCKAGAQTSTTDAVFEGAFDAGYKGDIRVAYDPPVNGMKQAHMIQEARWLGPCKAGQKPGDVILPGVNMQEMQKMMNDPRIQELMRQRQ